MLTSGSILPHHFSCTYIRSCRRSEANPNLRFPLTCLKQKQKCQFLGNQMFQFHSSALELQYANKSKPSRQNIAVYSGVESGPPHPSSGSWKMWILGVVISVILPFWRNKMWPLQQLKDKVESVVETAEYVADIVEDVAEQIEKVADDIADGLPEGGILQEAATFIEHVASETAKDAHLAGEVIDKVEEVVEEVENVVESIIEPVADQTHGISEDSES